MRPLPEEWRAVLAVAGFTPGGIHPPEHATEWLREVGESKVTARLEYVGNTSTLVLALAPNIGEHSMANHARHAAAASILWKTAMTLAERADATIVHRSLVGACRLEAGASNREVANYPSRPLRFEALCLGFRDVLMSGVGQDAG